jgi:hypothetical protein
MNILTKRTAVLLVTLSITFLIMLWGIRRGNTIEVVQNKENQPELSELRTTGEFTRRGFYYFITNLKKQGGDFFTVEERKNEIVVKVKSPEYKLTFDRVFNNSEPTPGELVFQGENVNDKIVYVKVPYEHIMSIQLYLSAGIK